MTPLKTYTKDPGATLDYSENWADPSDNWLGADTIVSSAWTVSAGLTKVSETNTTTTTTVWLSGGTDGADYTATCHVVTAGGREDERTLLIQVRQR